MSKEKNKLLKDKWAIKAIEYLVRKDYSSQEVIEAMAEFGIKSIKQQIIDNEEQGEEDAPAC